MDDFASLFKCPPEEREREGGGPLSAGKKANERERDSNRELIECEWEGGGGGGGGVSEIYDCAARNLRLKKEERGTE